MRAPLIFKSSLARRLPWVVLTPLVLGGCLPLPITIVSTAFTGVSYLATGKSTTDHVLSATVEEDCSLTNPIFGEDICKERVDAAEDKVSYIQVAQYPGDRDDGNVQWSNRSVETDEPATIVADTVLDVRAIDPPIAGLSSLLPPAPVVTVAGLSLSPDRLGSDRLGSDRPRNAAGIVHVAAAPSPSYPGTKVASADPKVTGPGGSMGTGANSGARVETWAPAVPKRAVEIAPLAAPAGAKTEPTGVRVPLANPPKQDLQKAPAPEVVKRDALPIEKEAPRSVPKVEIGSMGESGRYVVVGSFRDLDRAESLVARLPGKEAKILAADVKGERWNRVAMGPFPADEAVSVKRSLGSVGGREPWVAKLSNPIVLATR